MTNVDLHVVLGSGQIGSLVAEEILARGGRARVVRRGPPGSLRERLEWRSGDLSDLSFAATVGEGARVIYDCTSPSYDAWTTLLLPLARGAMHAAKTSGAKLVALDNLYMYGRTDGPIRETSAVAPCSRKGELRAKLAEERATAHARGELRIATGRAPDFFGPGVVRQTTYGERFYARIFAGKSAQCLGDPSLPHSLGYAPDVARGLVTLADHDEALGEIWHLPVNEAESMSQMTARMARALGREIAVSRIPRFALHAMGLFSPLLREVAEMAYQWDAPYLVDDTKFRAAFGGSATDIDEIVTETARWAVATYAPRAAAVASRAA